jgi:hypothetical protein
VPDAARPLEGMCRHCGSFGARPLGRCSVCEGAVCDKCGNVQFSSGERRATHDKCVRHDDAGFTMIKFVK